MSEENRENMQVDYHADDDDLEDPEIAALQAEIKNTNDSLLQTRNLQKALEEGSKATTSASGSAEAGSSAAGADGAAAEGSEEKEEVDGRSVFVGNVDYSATPEELQQHFQACGAINRITILCDKFTGHPKGFAYVEFSEQASVTNAMVLNESLFKGRQIQVTAKRTNKPAWQLGGRGRGRGRGSYRGGYQPRGGYSPYRGRGRGRGRGSFQ